MRLDSPVWTLLYCLHTSSPWKVIEIWNDYILMITYFLWTHLILCRAFVNNVWYIKILSPEDVQKLGKEEVESFSHHAGERTNTSGSDARSLVSGLPFGGSLEYWEWLEGEEAAFQSQLASRTVVFYFYAFLFCIYFFCSLQLLELYTCLCSCFLLLWSFGDIMHVISNLVLRGWENLEPVWLT